MNDERLIDANALAERINDCWFLTRHQQLISTSAKLAAADAMCKLLAEVAKQPTVDAVPVVHGLWIRCDGKSIVWYCSECGGKILYNPNPRTYNIKKPKVEQYNKFCRNCGAKMDLKEATNEENPDPV